MDPITDEALRTAIARNLSASVVWITHTEERPQAVACLLPNERHSPGQFNRLEKRLREMGAVGSFLKVCSLPEHQTPTLDAPHICVQVFL